MSIINILYKTVILLTCGIVQLVAVLFEGIGMIFEKLSDYLYNGRDKLMEQLEKKKETKKETNVTNIHVPL